MPDSKASWLIRNLGRSVFVRDKDIGQDRQCVAGGTATLRTPAQHIKVNGDKTRDSQERPADKQGIIKDTGGM